MLCLCGICALSVLCCVYAVSCQSVSVSGKYCTVEEIQYRTVQWRMSHSVRGSSTVEKQVINEREREMREREREMRETGAK